MQMSTKDRFNSTLNPGLEEFEVCKVGLAMVFWFMRKTVLYYAKRVEKVLVNIHVDCIHILFHIFLAG